MVDQPSGPVWGAPPPPMPPPPPPPAPGHWPTVAPPPFRSLRGLAVAMTVLLIVAGVLAAVLVPLSLHEREVVQDASSLGGFVVGGDVRDAIDAVNGVAAFYFLVFLAIAVLWMIWMWRAATNTAVLRRFRPRFANGFAVGGWFIPIAFWIIPGMHMYDIDRGSGPPARPGERPPGSGLLVVWWVIFVVGWAGSGFGQVTVKNGHRYETSGFEVRNAVFVVAMVAIVAAAILAILVVRSITRAQHDAWDTMVGSAPGSFAPGAAAWASPGPSVPPTPSPPPSYPPPGPAPGAMPPPAGEARPPSPPTWPRTSDP
jgi:hypothetical protein